MTDTELVHQTRDGDLQAFGRLVERHRGAVQGLAYHWTGSFPDAEDIAQEAFITAYLKLGQLRDEARFAAWMRQLTLNHCRRWKERRKPMETLDEADPAASGPSPAEELERAEQRDLVTRSLRRLSDNSRLVLTLHYLGDMSYSQIGHFLDLSVNAVAARMHRARKQLEESLMQTVSDSLRQEGLDDDFTRKVLEQAQRRARETQSQWDRDAFLVSVDKGLEAARQLEDGQAQIEMLSLLGDAGSSWLADSDKAVESYTSALDIARQNGDSAEEIRLLAALYSAHVRHGQWDGLHERASQALQASEAAGDLAGQAQARAALDLAEELPQVWSPEEPGGYAFAAFPVVSGPEGLTFADLVAQRRYSWGCPSRCAALMHLYRPRRILGRDLSPGSEWEDRVAPEREGMSWGLREDELTAASKAETDDDAVVVPAGRFASCLKVTTEIAPPEGDRARDHATRSYCGTRTAWFARGVGLVKLRHLDQNDTEWLVQLTAHGGPGSEDYFPLDLGRHWQYEHAEGWELENIFTDICRVVGAGDGVTWFSSATWARVRPCLPSSCPHSSPMRSLRSRRD
ncbi:RNA polymerase sigma factor [Candidatus Latescibacterota bacterium]